MHPTTELRFATREFEGPDGTAVPYKVLQQKWVQHHIPAGQTSAPSEWRDVRLATQEELDNAR